MGCFGAFKNPIGRIEKYELYLERLRVDTIFSGGLSRFEVGNLLGIMYLGRFS